MNYLFVSIGAALGGAARYWLADFVQQRTPVLLPIGTLAVNVAGSFLLGVFIFYFDARGLLSQQLRLFLTVGFCGGFTTFSTFSYETVRLLQDSEYLYAAINSGLNLFLTIGALFAAWWLSKLFAGG